MPLFFVLSGMSTRWSMRSRTPGQFLRSRAKRLLVPFLLCTFIVWIPVQVWIENVTHARFDGSFLEFYPHYFDGWYAFGGNFAWMGLHLWYLQMLFVFSLILLPVFLALRDTAAESSLRTVADVLARPGAILFLVAPLVIVELWVNRYPESLGMRAFGGWSPFTYVVFFMLGYLLATDPRYRDGAERSRWIALVATIAATALLSLGYWGPLDLPYWAFSTLMPLTSWTLLIAFQGFASRHLDFTSRRLAYANEAVLPFYILHQTVIVVLDYLMLDWGLTPALKYSALALLSLGTILAMYELLIRRFNPARLAMGMPRHR